LKQSKKDLHSSTKGTKDFCKGALMTALLNMALMLPAVFVFLFLDDYLRPVFLPAASAVHGAVYYVVVGLAFMLVMYVIAVFQYRSTYVSIYDESGNPEKLLATKGIFAGMIERQSVKSRIFNS
jgi:ATP-binding cassette subfamily B protein